MSKRTPSITPSKNGPLVVRHLEALKASTGRNVNTKASTVALCRCGGSKSKPYCDGTHGKNGFTDEKDKTRVPRRHDVYEGKTVTIHDDRGICSHAGYCTDGLPEVFQMGKEPWIDPAGASEDAIRKTIEKCPSGALSYEIDGKRFTAFASDEPELEITKDGPYRAKGFIDLESDDVPESKEHFALCRCGASKNKPFCDGSHHYEQFEDDGRFDPKIKGKEASKVPFDNHYDHIKNLSNDPEIEHSAMRTLETFPDFKTLLFKAAQLERMPLHKDEDVSLKTVIGKHAKKPLTIDLPFYVSHMSFGALSKEAKIALAKGSALASTATCSGEGGMPAEERDAAKYYIYEQGTAAFNYDEEKMKQADAIELKIGQGVKPGVGGYLPAHKVTEEIAKVRGLSENEASSAPNRLEGVDSTDDLKKRVDAIRKLTGGVPIGIKIATGNLEKDMSRALRAGPDFITIDCRGGATGASPTFLKDNVGIPPIYAIRRARLFLDSRKSDVTLCATGGFRDSTDIAKGLALGADAIALASASMIAIGCLQSRVCHTGKCPVGIATQDPVLRGLLDPDEGARKYANFAKGTASELRMIARSHGITDIHDLTKEDLMTTSLDVASHTDIEHV